METLERFHQLLGKRNRGSAVDHDHDTSGHDHHGFPYHGPHDDIDNRGSGHHDHHVNHSGRDHINDDRCSLGSRAIV